MTNPRFLRAFVLMPVLWPTASQKETSFCTKALKHLQEEFFFFSRETILCCSCRPLQKNEIWLIIALIGQRSHGFGFRGICDSPSLRSCWWHERLRLLTCDFDKASLGRLTLCPFSPGSPGSPSKPLSPCAEGQRTTSARIKITEHSRDFIKTVIRSWKVTSYLAAWLSGHSPSSVSSSTTLRGSSTEQWHI